MKTHYAECDRANESDNNDYWTPTACGLEYTESELSDRIEFVDCKKCLRVINKSKKLIKRHYDNR